MSQNSATASNSTESKDISSSSREEKKEIEYSLGDYVELQGTKKNTTRKGYIRFKGKIKVFGECVGIELDSKINDGNNGTFNDESYFTCDEGKGTFIKINKIIKKLTKNGTIDNKNNNNNIEKESKESKQQSDDKNAESFPANPEVIEKSEADQIKVKKKKKKKKKKTNINSKDSKDKKSTKKSSSSKNLKSSSSKDLKSKSLNKKSSSRKSNGSLTSSRKNNTSKKKLKDSKKKDKKEISFDIPKTGSNKDKLKFVYSKINNVKLPFKKRILIMQNTIPIIEDEKCDNVTAKFAIEGYKKCFVSQLTDRKKSVHVEALQLLQSMIKSLTKPFKHQIAHYLKHTMSYLEKADTKTLSPAENTIKLIINTCLVKDNKSLGIVVAELIRFGTSSKNKTQRKNGWKFIAIILKKYEPGKSSGVTSGKKHKKPPKAVLDALQTGLKQGLSDSDKATQKECMIVLSSMSLIDEARGEKIFARMSPATKRNYAKMSGKKGRTASTQLTKPIKFKKPKTPKDKKDNKDKKNNKKDTKRSSTKLSRTNSKTKDTKGGQSNNKKDTKGKKKKITKGNKKDIKNKKGKSDKDKSDKINTKTPKGGEKDNNKIKPKDKINKDDDSKADKVEQVIIQSDNITDDSAVESVVVSDTPVDNTTDTTPVSTDSNSNEISESTTSEAYIKAEAEIASNAVTNMESKKPEEKDSEIGEEVLEDEELELNCTEPVLGDEYDDDEDEDDSEEDSDSDSSSSTSSGDSTSIIGGQSSENDARDLIESFLDLKDPQINWKMIEFLSKDNMTHLLMSYISRMPQGPKIWQENLEVSMDKIIGATKELYSLDNLEIRATQLSYSLMRILSNEHCAETVKSFLLRKCQEICLHALAVFHPLSAGNVYHGRVVLEILLNHWPKSFMAALANQRHIQTLLKCALFRNLHQGNLNSFFLDLICFRPSTKIGQIQPVKKKLISMFVEWKFMEYLLLISTNNKNGDDIATKYSTFFIDMVARCASISEASDLFIGFEYLIIDSFMNGLLNSELTIWHRISCGQTLVQFLDISSRPTIMDPASAMAGMLGVVAPDPMTNILHPMFDKSLSRLHTFIPQMCATICNKNIETTHLNNNNNNKPLRLACGEIPSPFGQVKLNCLELLTVSADFAQFKCGNVLSLLPFDFWSELLNMAFIHNQNNMYLCHFRRLIHLSMIFRRRFLKHLFINDKLLERFVDYYQNKPHPRTTLHGYILQMLWDIYNHDQRDDDEDDDDDDDDEEENDDNNEEEEEEELQQRDSVVINDDLPQEIGADDGNENKQPEEEPEEEQDDEFGDDVVLKPNFSKEAQDQWDIVQFFNNNEVWKQFIVTVSLQMEAQNATETQVPNMNLANNQQQLDQLLQNLLGPNNDENSDSDSSDSDSD